MEALDRIEAGVLALTRTPFPTEIEAADWIGRLAKISKDVNDYKRSLLSEMTHGPVRGEQYQVNETRSASRSYNSAGLLHAFAAKGWSLPDLVREDAVRLSWRWTELNRAFGKADVDVLITRREIEDNGEIDGPLVGEVWSSTMSVEGIKQ